jgi:hypothetical protein
MRPRKGSKLCSQYPSYRYATLQIYDPSGVELMRQNAKAELLTGYEYEIEMAGAGQKNKGEVVRILHPSNLT